MRSSIAGTWRLCDEGGGGVVFTVAYMIAFTLSPSNGAWPVSDSYSTTPREKMSLRASIALPMTCSGDM